MSAANKPRLWVFVIAGAVAVVGGWAMFAFDSKLAATGNWAIYVGLAVLYIAVQIVTESAVGMFWDHNRWFSKLIAVGAVLAFYLIWFRVH